MRCCSPHWRFILLHARWLVLVALCSGVIWLIVSTAPFEGRPDAALEARANRPPDRPSRLRRTIVPVLPQIN
jgi:hypothetical protein